LEQFTFFLIGKRSDRPFARFEAVLLVAMKLA
jgi:hypothetical protein